jgi:hypothetical protein
VFDSMEKSSKFLLESITLVSSANQMGSDKVFVVGRGSYVCVCVCVRARLRYEKQRP